MTTEKNPISLSSVSYLFEGVVVLLFLGLIYAWSIFRAPLEKLFPDWTPTQMSVTFTISIIFFCLGGFIAGKIANIVSHRIIMMSSAILILVGFSIVSIFLNENNPDKSLFIMYIFYGVFFGTAVGLSYNTLLGVILNHFVGRAGIASGVLLFGFGAGGLLVGKIITDLIEAFGIHKMFIILGVILASILIIASLLIKKPLPKPSDSLSSNNSDSADIRIENVKKDKTLIEAISKPTFWLIMFWDTQISIGGLLVINSAAPIAESFGMLPLTGLLVAVFNGVGRPLTGIIFDMFGRKKAMFFVNILLITSGFVLLSGALTRQPIFIYLGLPLVGLAYGGTPTALATVVNVFYGQKHFQIILASITFSLIIAAIVGPILSSLLQEISGRDYTTSFIMLIVVGFITLIFCALITKHSKKEGLE